MIIKSASDGLLYNFIIYFIGSSIIISQIFTFFPLLFIGIFLNELYKKFALLPRNNFSILFAYLLILCAFPELWNLSSQLLGFLTLLYAIFLLFEASLQEFKIPDLINLAILFSLSSLIYKPLYILVIYLPIALLSLRQFKFKLILITLLMWSLPYIYLYVYYFLIGNNLTFKSIFATELLNFHFKYETLNINNLISSIFTLILFLLSIWKVINNYANRLIHIRSIISLTIAFLLITTYITFFSKAANSINIILLIPSISAIIGIGLQYFKKTLYLDIIFSIYIISSVYFYF